MESALADNEVGHNKDIYYNKDNYNLVDIVQTGL
jgi:hypothetical protein